MTTLKKLELYVQNLDCENEAARIQAGLKGVAGLASVQVMPAAAKVVIEHEPAALSADAARAKLRDLGFPERPRAEETAPPPWKNAKVLSSLASGAILLVGWLLGFAPTGALPPIVQTAVYIVAAAVGAYYFAREALEDLFKEREVGIELLMTAAAVAAIALGHAGEGAMLAFLYSISEAAEGYTAEKTRSAIRALMKLAPKTALVRRNGKDVEVPVEALNVGDIFIVKPGGAIATDGVVVAGASSVNQAPITGESAPVDKVVGDTVFAGTLNTEGALDVRVTHAAADNTLARIISMVEEAQEKKADSERFIDRFGRRYSPVVLLVGVAIGVVPPLALSAEFSEWLIRATVFIVAAAPCALVISIPITMVATLGTAARKGILIKGGTHVEDLARVRVVAFDKTGTLTVGKPDVTDFIAWPGASVDEATALRLAAAVERKSQHPLAEAIVRYVESKALDIPVASSFASMTAAGARGEVDGRALIIAKPAYFADTLRLDIVAMRPRVEELEAQGKTVVLVGDERAVWGLFAIRDRIRENAKKAIADLHAIGIVKVVMLTGDNPRTAAAIAKELGIDVVHADLKPEDKSKLVGELAQFGPVAMVGDGVNDAPALAAATVGVAMGAAGTDVALETADVALMGDDLERLVYAIQLAQRSRTVVKQNLALSVVVISVLVVGAVSGWFALPIAVLGHEISEFIVIGSGLRMLRA